LLGSSTDLEERGPPTTGTPFAARPVALGESKMAPIISIAGCVLLFVGLCAAVVNLSQDDNTSVRR
jgi:hypothetical protein